MSDEGTASGRVLSLDWQRDERGAAPPPSRFGNYLGRQHQALAAQLAEGGPRTWLVSVSDIAIRRATGLVKVERPALRSVRLVRDDDDVLARLEVACEPLLREGARIPPRLEGRPLRRWRYSGLGRRVEPPGLTDDVGRVATLLTTAQLDLPLAVDLVEDIATEREDQLLDAARIALEGVVAQINALAPPVLAVLAPAAPGID